jgi:hypothetical protein
VFIASFNSQRKNLAGRAMVPGNRLGISNAQVMGTRSPSAGTHAGAPVKRPGKIVLPQVTEFVRDFFDRMVTCE